MAMMAICSSFECSFQMIRQDGQTGRSFPTPELCPDCYSPVIARCMACHFMIIGKSEQRAVECELCNRDLRLSFLKAYGRMIEP
jgi:hypothetical protein